MRIVAVVLAAATGLPAADPVAEVEAYHRDFQNEGEGIVLVTVAEGKVIVSSAGSRKEGGPGMDGDTLFEIGSLTKVFTGILLADAVNRGAASLEDPVTRFLPEGLLSADSPLHQVTLVELSTHTSGLPRLPSNFDEGGNPKDPYAAYSVERLYEYLKGFQTADFVKRGKTSYSNLGVGLLGHALERLAGKPYEELVRDTIFAPLGMNSSFVQRRPGDLPAEAEERFATGHRRGKEVPRWYFDALCGAGAIVSTGHDLALFAAAHFTPQTPPSLFAAMKRATERQRGEVGLGWFLGKEGLHHDGATGGFRSQLRVSVPDKTATIRLMSGTGPSGIAESRGDFTAFAGFWQGTLGVAPKQRDLFFRISEGGRVVLHSLDEGGQGMPAVRTSCEGGHFRAVFGAIQGCLEGHREGERFVGTWSQNGAYPLALAPVSGVPSALREALAGRFTGDWRDLRGFWSGHLGGNEGLFLVLEIDGFDDLGDVRLYSPDQTSDPLPVTHLSFGAGRLKLVSAPLRAEYSATLGEDGHFTGLWKQGSSSKPLPLVRSEAMPERE